MVVKHIVVCCDGTWCGDSKETTTNVEILAKSFALGTKTDEKGFPNVPSKDGSKKGSWQHYNEGTKTLVGYFDGAGLEAGNFLTYLVNGAITLDIKKLCVDPYEFIVKNFKPDIKIWLFGLSRGAFTVRSVAAMINSCGILEKIKNDNNELQEIILEENNTRSLGVKEEELKSACEGVYDIYTNRDPQYHPDTQFSKDFRTKMSYSLDKPPIRFMGLFDTVGSLGIPTIKPGAKLSYEFYDQVVSEEVQTVCQALALTDRLAVFEPCFVRRDQTEKKPKYEDKELKYETEEVWFPGSHYDIGRQRFLIPRTGKGVGFVERQLQMLQKNINLFRLQVAPTKKLSNAPLVWMIEKIKEVGKKEVSKELLSQHANEYIIHARDDLPNLLGGLLPAPLFPAFYIDAYDEILEHNIWWLSQDLRNFIKSQVLADRQIALYDESAKFFSPAELQWEPEEKRRARLTKKVTPDDEKVRDTLIWDLFLWILSLVLLLLQALRILVPQKETDCYRSKSFEHFILMGGVPNYEYVADQVNHLDETNAGSSTDKQ